MKINYLGYEKKYNERTGETHYDKNSYRLAVITVNTNKQSEMDLFYKIAEKAEEEGYRYSWGGGDEEYTEAFFEVEDKADYLYFKRIYMKVKRTKNETTEVEISETTAKTETAEEVVDSVEETTAPEAEQTAETAEQETVEGISKTETTTGTDDSGFKYYSVKVAYEVIKDEIRSALFTSYSLALKVAKDFTDMWGGDKAIVTEVSLMVRNDRQPTNERDKRVLEDETAEIERRCVPYHDWLLSGYVSKEDRQVVNA